MHVKKKLVYCYDNCMLISVPHACIGFRAAVSVVREQQLEAAISMQHPEARGGGSWLAHPHQEAIHFPRHS